MVGILIGYQIIKFLDRKYEICCGNKQFYDDILYYLVLGIVLGGRIGYCLCYNPIYFIKHPVDILAIWQGGMSFHGGLIGVLISSILLCKKYEYNTLIFLDSAAVAAPIGLFLGRIANFINLELYGRPTNLPWGVIFPNVDELSRHPSQLYEAFFEGVVLLLIQCLLVYKKKFKIPGLNSIIFVVFYSIFRFILEFFREPDSQIGLLFGYLTLGQILSILTMVVLLFVLKEMFKKTKNEK